MVESGFSPPLRQLACGGTGISAAWSDGPWCIAVSDL